ncbi:MAG: SPOR domain-containing protein [Alphaproteobacteria bacterium]|nr:SPOR domain-containing protein [Alphaproteobacteria bacterium]
MYQDFFNKNDDYLDRFKQKVAEQKIATMEERRSEMARSRNNFLGTFAGIVLAGVVGWFVLAPQYEQTHKEIPVIQRPQTAVKIKPENPGGMDIPNRDKDVYNIVEKKTVDNTVVENLLPEPEKPKLPDIVPDDIEVDANAKNLDEIVDEVVDEKVVKTDEAKVESQVPEKPADILNGKKEEVKENVKEVVKTVVKEPVKEVAKVAEKVDVKGAWQIQLIASKNKEATEKTWNNLAAKYPLLKSYSHEVQSDNLGAQGMIYKLRAGNFATKEQAQAACAALRAKGLNDCIAKER